MNVFIVYHIGDITKLRFKNNNNKKNNKKTN